MTAAQMDCLMVRKRAVLLVGSKAVWTVVMKVVSRVEQSVALLDYSMVD